MLNTNCSKHRLPQESIRLAVSLWIIYVVFLAYGTLFPLSAWRIPAESPWDLMLTRTLHNASRSDIVTNILIYIPLGLLLMRALSNRRCRYCMILAVTLAGALISLTLEYFQAHLPGRVPSVSDLILNTGGSLIGAIIAVSFASDTGLGKGMLKFRLRYFLPGRLTDIGLLVLGFWVLAQLSPLVPSLDLSNLRNGVKPLLYTLRDPQSTEWLRLVEYALAVGALGMLGTRLVRVRAYWLKLSIVFFFAVLLLKVPVVGRQLSAEALVGTIIGLGAARTLIVFPKSFQSLLSVAFLLGVILLTGIYTAPDDSGLLPRFYFNWVPFSSHLNNDIIGLIDIFGGLWPFLALSFIAIASNTTRRWSVIIFGAVSIFAAVFALEWNQQYLPGRSADITDALLAVGAWISLWVYRPLSAKQVSHTTIAATSDSTPRAVALGNGWLLFTVSVILAGSVLFASPFMFNGTRITETEDSLLPPPRQLPPVDLPLFRYTHPRLPVPSAAELSLLREKNPRYLKNHKKSAKSGNGKLYSVVLSELAEPGSQDLTLLHQRLISLELSWRGHQQAKPLAVAYDWLYDRWTPEQRRQLQDKVIEAANYLIGRIRVKQKLSPYNVYLYNSPFQALMAVALSVYGDLPEAELPMRWTQDYWLNRVLPVWRQIMGRNGGWHEGGEYVGIGIGQAVYQVPAMWRSATGQDVFRTEPGLRGFLDFLVYRTRPDSTHMRWGDAAHFDRRVPDRIPLAIEYNHKPGYSLGRCPRPYRPTSWPWGPLTSDIYCDSDAINDLPLEKHFDGIGMVIARSSWEKDATYLTFKAGDNYWSHSHLDQGSFTLFRNEPLIIDSGLYGPRYGSDHHMNYSYQTIAHNVGTVSDPADNIPAPAKKEEDPPRAIANDGGQRRIGSGWGVERAPLDLEEWQDKKEIYHTGRIIRYLSQDGLVAVVADITPAYTNSYSGKGNFSDRTRRVDKYYRTFIYDRTFDLVVIHDNIVTGEKEHAKRILFHTIDRPFISEGGFIVQSTSDNENSPAKLSARVLFPENARITAVGGRGREFLVDGINYDEGGKIWRLVQKRRKNPPQPGSWRIEVSPRDNNLEDRFLTIFDLNSENSIAGVQLERMLSDTAIGVKISRADRALTIRFPRHQEGVIIKMRNSHGAETFNLISSGGAIGEKPLGSVSR